MECPLARSQAVVLALLTIPPAESSWSAIKLGQDSPSELDAIRLDELERLDDEPELPEDEELDELRNDERFESSSLVQMSIADQTGCQAHPEPES